LVATVEGRRARVDEVFGMGATGVLEMILEEEETCPTGLEPEPKPEPWPEELELEEPEPEPVLEPSPWLEEPEPELEPSLEAPEPGLEPALEPSPEP
jgi:hypothetical protein